MITANINNTFPRLRAAGRCWVLGAGVLGIILPGQTTQAATIRFEPNASVKETYTDNVRSVTGGAEADFITESSVGGRLTADGNRLNLNLDLSGSYELYHNTKGLDGFRPSVFGKGDTELLKDRLFVDGFVSLSEVTASRQGSISATDRALPSNKRQLMTYSIEPRLEHRFGRTAAATLSYLFSETTVSEPGAGGGVSPGDPGSGDGDSESQEVNLELSTGPKFSQLETRLEVSNQTNKSVGSSDFTKDRAELINEYQLTRQISLIARGGYEDIGDANAQLDSSGATGALGFRFKPGPKLDVRIEKGRRFQNGNTDFEMTYKISPFYTLSSSFTQSVENQASERLNRSGRLIVDPLRGDVIDPITGNIVDPNDSRFTAGGGSFQQDQFRVGLVAIRGRNTLNLGGDFTSRDAQTGGSSEDQVDVSLDFTRAMRRDLTGSLGLGYNDVIQSGTVGGGQTTYRSVAQFEYALGKVINTSLEFNRLLRTSETRDDLSEDVVMVGIDANF